MAMLLAFTLPALAQKINVHGHVVDETGEELIGATVMEKGTQNGAATDFDGNFDLVVDSHATLVVSYVGYDSLDVPVNGRTDLHIVMTANSTMLAETVVIGYGTVKKSDATGSVALVQPDEVEAGISTSAQDLLTGASPGVVVTSSGGSPEGGAEIRIRGGASLSASNEPLIVLDGVPLSSDDINGMTNPLAMISPDNIESMTILKDASATAIYGSRASNGVIIITTKKGKAGRPQVNFSASVKVETARKKWDTLNASEFKEQFLSYYGPDAPNYNADAMSYLGTSDTDWQNEVLRTAISQDYNLSIGGTVGFLPYRISGSYTMNNGILKDSQMQRVTAGFTLNPRFFDGLLQINATAKGYYVRNKWSDTGAVGAAISFNPTQPVYTNIPTGNDQFPYYYNGFYTVTGANQAFNINASRNPVSMFRSKNNYSDVWRSNGSLQIDYALHFLPELHFNLNLGYDVTKSTDDNYVFQNSPVSWKESPRQNGAGYYTHKYYAYRNTMLNFYLNYKKEFDAIYSMLDVTAGYEWQRFDKRDRNNGTILTSAGFLNPGDNGGQLLIDPSTESMIGSTYTLQNFPYYSGNLVLMSFFGRLNYTFKDTYLLTFTLRDDGTSRFSKDNRWGLFPALALAWKINNMPFMEGWADNMNEFKLRLGWGVTGQQAVSGWFPAVPVYVQSTQGSYYPNIFTGTYRDANGNIISQTYYPAGYNANLKWEETTTWNVGFDMGWWNNRLTVALDWYLRQSKDLLSRIPVAPGSTTTNYMDQNIGTLENLGLEATIGGKPIMTDNFTWTTAFNVAWNRNEITKLNNEGTAVQVGDISGGTGNKCQVQQVGYPAYSFMLYEQVYDEMGRPIEGCYVDQDGNGQIDSNDLVIKHHKDPTVTMSWNNSFSWGNWDLGIQLRASIGNYVYNNVLAQNTSRSKMYQNGLNNMVRNDVYFDGADNFLSDYWLENASFVRCDNITLGYTWSDLIDGNLRLRLYGAVQNPFVITRYRGIDPEIPSGIDNDVYPRPVSFTLGVIATF